MHVKGTKFDDRQAASAKAKQELLARARAKSPTNDPDFAARQAAKAQAARERDERHAQRKAEKAEAARIAEETRIADEKRMAEEARVAAEQAEAERLRREIAEQIAEAKKKLAADTRFAQATARKKK